MDIEKLKNDKEFIAQLQKTKEEALKTKDIVKMYDVLDTMLALDLEDEDIDALYEEILRTAFDRLANMLTDGEKFDFTKEYDEYVARAVYEHALERWDRRDFKGAKELFLILSFLVPQNYQEAMLTPMAAAATQMELDRFLEEFVDKEAIEEESFFLDRFTSEAKKFVEKNRKLIEEELKNVEKLV